jgi:putative DNA methylase
VTELSPGVPRRKLIEVALPLEAINRALKGEKDRKVGKPQQIHHWWARRPITAARAVLFAQLVDDPSSWPDRFPTEADQATERLRLFRLLERLLVWNSAWDNGVLREAHAEIAASFDGQAPAILDPFAGGGSIPLEAQRLGLQVTASDLNPVAVLINRALVEIPSRWEGHRPTFPGAAAGRLGDWSFASGLAEDVRRYGQWIKDEAARTMGHLYPEAILSDGSRTGVISWLWARTVKCPNPACGATMPLISNFWLSKNKPRPTWLEPVTTGKSVTFDVIVGGTGPQAPPKQGRGARFACLVCADVTTERYIKEEGSAGRMGRQLLSIVAEGNRQRLYLPADPSHEKAADVPRPIDLPLGNMPDNPRWFSPPAFGMASFTDLFTNRQLISMTTFSDLVIEARARVATDAQDASVPEPLAYADAVVTFLALALSRLADWSNSMCRWESVGQVSQQLFGRQAIPMVWDYSEANVLGSGSGSWDACIRAVSRALEKSRASGPTAVSQADAQHLKVSGPMVVCTDPPYYDNIGYADLADFFYVWLRRTLMNQHSNLTTTVLSPKTQELVAAPSHFGGDIQRARTHFESGLIQSFRALSEIQTRDAPLTVFYAFKQDDAQGSDGMSASTGWETMLNGLTSAGLMVTATWPFRTEMASRLVGRGTNALESSIVLACRRRPDGAAVTTRRGLLQALQQDLPQALRELQQGSIAPVDLAQAAIGPGMAVFTRFRSVVEADGSAMTVRTALALINQALDEVLSEQEGDFDADTRFCLKWFTNYGWNEAGSGTADTLSRATNSSVAGLERGGVFKARAGRARLLSPTDLSEGWDPTADDRVSAWEVVVRLAKALNEHGGEEAARLLALAGQRVDLATAKELAYLLYSISDKRGWTASALMFNGLGTSWSELSAAARGAAGQPIAAAQTALNFDDEGE